jgi:NAD(P)H-dependent FMN reductase
MPIPVRVVGLGGSLRAESTSRTALQTAPDGVLAAGAEPRMIWVRDLDLPLYTRNGPCRQRPVSLPTRLTRATR